MRGKADYSDLDHIIADIDAREERDRKSAAVTGIGTGENRRTEIGIVEKYFDKIGVVAISLTGELKAGDLIEIGSNEEHVRQRVQSMQINKQDVESAFPGDSVGIKMKYHVDEGSSVYKLQ